MSQPQKMIRAVFRSAEIPGLPGASAVVHVKLYYPALYGDTPGERNTGDIPPDMTFAPLPIIIFAPGINLALDSYAWMARGLAEQGFAVAVYHTIAEPLPGHISLSPALDPEALRADYVGGAPAGAAFKPILDMLEQENAAGVLKNALDLSCVHFGGHSAGGSTALLSADKSYFPNLKSVFSYGAHTGMSMMMGYPKGTIKPIGDVSCLIMGGSRDGCIANSAHRYGDPVGDATGRVIKTFEDGVMRCQNDSCLVIIEGANHFTFGYPVDHTTGRSFIDLSETCDGEAARALMLAVIQDFCRSNLEPLKRLPSNPMIADSRIK